MELDKLMTVSQLAKRFNVTSRTVRRWIEKGMPVKTVPGFTRKRMINADEVAKWLYGSDEKKNNNEII